MRYNYGSPPKKYYNYTDFVRHIAPVLPADDRVFFYKKSIRWRKELNRIPCELFRNICHWKSNRRFKKVCKNKPATLNRRWNNALQGLNKLPYEEKAIRNAFKQLTQLDGVETRTASALLTAWNPFEFGILDYKVLEVLKMDMRYSVKTYLKYRDKLLALRRQYPELKNCALRQIEFALWHYYSIQKAGEAERPGDE
jgi:hypothetical protein